MERSLAIWNFLIACLALIIAILAIYQASKYRNLKISISDANLSKWNAYDPYLVSFTLNNLSNVSLEVQIFELFLDRECSSRLEYVSNFNPKGPGWKKPEKPAYDTLGNILNFGETLNMSIAIVEQYEEHIDTQTVIHASTSINGRYYINQQIDSIYIRVLFDKRLSLLKKELIVKVDLGPLIKKY